MHGGAASGGIGPLGLQAATVELRQALEQQARELDAVLARFTDATRLMPTSPDREWRGLAQLFYGWALDRLRAELNGAEEQLRSARETLGDDFWSYGVAPARKTLETFVRHHHSQGLSPREVPVEELFHPSTYETYSI